MSEAFDPYHKWLAIPAEEQPPNHYRLLGVHLFEEDADVIDSAADRQMGHVRRFATGQRGELSQKILNEISNAKVTLLNPKKRAAYDAALRQKVAAKEAAFQLQRTAQAIPTSQALPQGQAIPVSAQAASPQLRTRGQQPQPASSNGFDIPIVDKPKSVAQRRKKKSSPVLTIIALIAVAGALIGALFTLMSRQEEPVAKKTEKIEKKKIVKPPGQVIVRPNQVKPVTSSSGILVGNTDEDPEENDGNIGQGGGPGGGARIPGSGGGRGIPGSGRGGQSQGPPIDRLADLDLEQAVVSGNGWSLEDGVLITGKGDGARVQIPHHETEYILSVTAERSSGNGQLYLGLPVEGGKVSCIIDISHNRPAGVFASGFYDGSKNVLMERTGSSFFAKGGPVEVRCVVRNEQLILSVDGKFVGAWKRDSRSLQSPEHWSVPEKDVLTLGVSHTTITDTTFKISQLEYQPFIRRVIASTTPSPDPDKIVGSFGEKVPGERDPFDGSENNSPMGKEPPRSSGSFDNLGKKTEPPTEEKQAETIAVLQDLFPDEFAAAKSTAGKLALGQKLYDTAQKTNDDPVALYVLLTQASNYSAEGGNAEVPMRALANLNRQYNVDLIALYVETFDKVLKGARTPTEHEGLLHQIKQAIVAAQAEDRYEEAEKLMRMAQSSARVTKDNDVIKEIAASAKELRDAKSEFDKVSSAKKTLASDPDDADANTEWGQYLCTVKNDFPQGMPLLAKGSDTQLKAAATADLALPREAKDQIAVGDKWFALGDAASGSAETMLRLRAGYWYQRGVLGLMGLEKTRIEKRLSDIAELEREGLPQAKPSAPPTQSDPTPTTEATGRISMVGRGMIEGQDMGVTLTYELGQTVSGRDVREALNKVGVDSDARVELNLGGNLVLRKPTDLTFRLKGGSSSGGVCYLQINQQEVASVGDDRNKDATVTRTLPAGIYLIGMRITGGDMGDCVLECTETESNNAVRFSTQVLMFALGKLPTKATINLGQIGE